MEQERSRSLKNVTPLISVVDDVASLASLSCFVMISLNW